MSKRECERTAARYNVYYGGKSVVYMWEHDAVTLNDEVRILLFLSPPHQEKVAELPLHFPTTPKTTKRTH